MYNLNKNKWILDKGTGTNQCVTVGDLSGITGANFGSSYASTYCPTRSEIKDKSHIMEGYKVNVSGIYGDNQLVRYSDVTYSEDTLNIIGTTSSTIINNESIEGTSFTGTTTIHWVVDRTLSTELQIGTITLNRSVISYSGGTKNAVATLTNSNIPINVLSVNTSVSVGTPEVLNYITSINIGNPSSIYASITSGYLSNYSIKLNDIEVKIV